MPKKVILNLLLIIGGFSAVFFVADLIGGAPQLAINWAAGMFAVNCLAVFLTALKTFGPIGTRSDWEPKHSLLVASVIGFVIAFTFGGIFAVLGSLTGTAAALYRYRGAL